MNDLISIIVPVYNVEQYIDKCITSIINQSYKNIEIILVDDGSTDNSGKICDKYKEKDTRISVKHKTNEGVSSARNYGIESAKGKWICFIDADDWIDDNYCEIMHDTAIKYNADVVLCGYNRVTPSKTEKINNDDIITEVNSREYLINSLNPQTGYGFCHMKIYCKDIIKDIRFKEKMQVGEDAFFNEQISKNIKKAIFLNKSIYNYRINANSVVRKFDINYVNKYKESMKINKEFIIKNYKDDINIIQNLYNFIAFHVLLIAVNYCFNNENPRKDKTNLLKEICNYQEFYDGIKKCNYEKLSTTRKITLFTIKHRLYILTSLICKYRQKKNKK